MPHFTAQDEFEPTPNSLLARAASGSAPTQGAYVDRRRSQRRAQGHGQDGAAATSGDQSGQGGARVERGNSRRERDRSSRLYPSQEYVQGQGGQGVQAGYEQYAEPYQHHQQQQAQGFSQTRGPGLGQGQGQGHGQGYGDLQYGRPQSQLYNDQYQSQGQWGAFAHGSSMGYAGNNASSKPLYYNNGDGDDPDQAFDVRADFDGTGPRWSERYGTGKGDPRKYVRLIDRNTVVTRSSGRLCPEAWEPGRGSGIGASARRVDKAV